MTMDYPTLNRFHLSFIMCRLVIITQDFYVCGKPNILCSLHSPVYMLMELWNSINASINMPNVCSNLLFTVPRLLLCK